VPCERTINRIVKKNSKERFSSGKKENRKLDDTGVKMETNPRDFKFEFSPCCKCSTVSFG
jgi:hypothetical protein